MLFVLEDDSKINEVLNESADNKGYSLGTTSSILKADAIEIREFAVRCGTDLFRLVLNLKLVFLRSFRKRSQKKNRLHLIPRQNVARWLCICIGGLGVKFRVNSFRGADRFITFCIQLSIQSWRGHHFKHARAAENIV